LQNNALQNNKLTQLFDDHYRSNVKSVDAEIATLAVERLYMAFAAEIL